MSTELKPTEWNYRPTHQRIYPPSAPESFRKSRSLQEPIRWAAIFWTLIAGVLGFATMIGLWAMATAALRVMGVDL